MLCLERPCLHARQPRNYGYGGGGICSDKYVKVTNGSVLAHNEALDGGAIAILSNQKQAGVLISDGGLATYIEVLSRIRP